MNAMHYWYFTELDRKSGLHTRIHRVALPSPSETGFYRQTVSLSAFLSGKRSDATKEDIAKLRHTCPWSPTKFYVGHTEEEWELELENTDRLHEKYPQLESYRKLPVLEHPDIYAFQEAIGFDRKTRRYDIGNQKTKY